MNQPPFQPPPPPPPLGGPQKNLWQKQNDWARNSLLLKVFTVGLLILLSLIPITWIQDLIREREYRQTEAINSVNADWGNAQTVKGLVLTVPYKTYTKRKIYNEDPKAKPEYETITNRNYAYFLPEKLDIDGDVSSTQLNRGLFEVVVYNSQVNFDGSFLFPDFKQWNIPEKDVLWDEASVSLGISDLRSIQQQVTLNWDNGKYLFDPGVPTDEVIAKGISTKISLANRDSSEIKFSLNFDFNGSSSLHFVPLGKTTNVNLKSGWKDPSFGGAFLPDQREVTDHGFTASWSVLHLNRPYPQSFTKNKYNIDNSEFGVNLIMPVDQYQKSMRAAKYAIMFITLTFMVFFFVQVMNNIRIHPIQYIMVGLALCLFYTLLISFSEHIPFMFSYAIASVAIIGMVGLYTLTIFKHKRLTLYLSLILVALYLFIFTIIQMQDYALLMGSIGLFIVLAITMYVSRKIDWFNLAASKT